MLARAATAMLHAWQYASCAQQAYGPDPTVYEPAVATHSFHSVLARNGDEVLKGATQAGCAAIGQVNAYGVGAGEFTTILQSLTLSTFMKSVLMPAGVLVVFPAGHAVQVVDCFARRRRLGQTSLPPLR